MGFWCFEGHEVRFDLVLAYFDQFWPTLPGSLTYPDTYFDLFRRADLTYFHLSRPISFHNKAPWTGPRFNIGQAFCVSLVLDCVEAELQSEVKELLLRIQV